jgi:putative salt-induced outer membrane protein
MLPGKKLWLLVSLMMVSGLVQAAEPASATASPAAAQGEEQPKSVWNGEAELGLLVTSGNTDTQTLNARLTIDNTRPKWEHQFRLEAVRTEDSSAITAERYTAFTRSRYLLSQVDYLFGNLRYEDDRFAGYDQRTTEVAGYGRKFYNSDAFKLSAEVGAGARQTDYTTGEQVDEAIVRLGTDLFVALSETSSFKETLFVESGDSNTYTESTSELKLKVNSSLAMKLTLTVKDNSDPPVGNKHTDTETAVTLVYDF